MTAHASLLCKTAVAAALFATSFATVPAEAQTLREQAAPFSVWLDLRAVAAGGAPPRVALPIWLESVQRHSLPPRGDVGPKTIFRLRLRRLGHLNTEIQLRLFFDDQPGQAPSVTAWSETGALQFESRPLGIGLRLPTSEALRIPVGDADYLEVEVPGDGRVIRGAFLATLTKTETHQALDFTQPAEVVDPFENLPSAEPPADDAFLYGRVKATLEPGVLKVAKNDAPPAFDFELEQQPLLAVVTFEVLNIDPLHPPEVTVNTRALGSVALHLPDLADPGYEGSVRSLERDMRFKYAGWLRCQKVIPGAALEAGLNKLVLQLSNQQSGAVAIRAVEIQLKYTWQNLEFKLLP